ncbi:putative serine/threonine-protein kinase NAK [Acorus calamus]|uniref:Serine/threonine-protein kinase NAK n=1 Tax=Acorus calamus TaxID=4465 RepID=A0AAV9DVM4_ACOCL|nr:putative serine/threonine-protein kinase NAK [Acorus calamus]
MAEEPIKLISGTNTGKSSGSVSESLDEVFPNGRILAAPNLRIFTFSELRGATKNFKPETVLGEGGFGKVFKGWLDEKSSNPSRSGGVTAIAVKKLNSESMQGLQEWQDYNAKISDFGLAKNGPLGGDSHVTTRVMGTYGYAAPEYVATGHLYVKSDVYGFGVVLLEMLTGERALDTNRPSAQHNYVDYAKPYLNDRRRLTRIMDPRFEGQYPAKAALQAAQLTLRCLAPEPKNRPPMKEVVETLEGIAAMKGRSRESGRRSVEPRPGRHRAGPPTVHGHAHAHAQRSPLHPRHDGVAGGARAHGAHHHPLPLPPRVR